MSCFTGNSLNFEIEPEKLESFFENLNNFKFIMPEQVENWQSDENNCSFFIKNLGNLGMKKGNFVSNECFTFVSNHSSKVGFVLCFYLKPAINQGHQGYFEICAEMNPMIEMMAKRPLTNFVTILTANLQAFLASNH
jgi:hypothetical protein